MAEEQSVNIKQPATGAPTQGASSLASNPFAAKKSFSPTGQGTPGAQRKRRGGNPSEYKKSLQEKQTLKREYGMSERQFKRYVQETLAKMGKVDDVSAELIRKLEKRLDNVIFRLGFAITRPQARQLVSHRYFLINGKPVNIASYQVEKDDIISLKENKKSKGIFKELSDNLKTKEVPVWLNLDKTKLTAKTIGEPTLEEVKPAVEISLIFEFYSR